MSWFCHRLALVCLLIVSCTSSAVADELVCCEAAHDEVAVPTAVVELFAPSRSNRLTCWCRDRWVKPEHLKRYGLRIDSQELPTTAPVVILLHGFNSTCERNAALLKPLREAGYACGTFAYPNDQPLQPSAQLLSMELRAFAARHPGQRVVLLTHSMGGLVARACVENSHLDPGNVSRLIMIGPPSQGTLLAKFAVGTDVWEHWVGRRKGSAWTRFHDSLVDGLGDAAVDLCPESEFLTGLNSVGRNSEIAYTVLLGTGATMSSEELAWMHASIRQTVGRVPGLTMKSREWERLVADLDELVEGRGDGAVAVKRGQLDGVSDTMILPFGHLSVSDELRPGDETVPQIHRAILVRLAQ